MGSNNPSSYGSGSNRSRIYHTSYCNTAAMQACLCSCHANVYGSNPMNHWYNNVVPNSTNWLTYQGVPQNPISGFSHVNNLVNPLYHVENDQQSREQMATKYNEEIDSWLLLSPNNWQDQNILSSHQIDGCLNLKSYNPWSGNQLQTQGVQQVNNNQSYRQGLAEQQEEQTLKFYQGSQGDCSRAAFNNSPASFLDASLPQTGAGFVSEATIGSFSNKVGLPREWALNQILPFHPRNLTDETVENQSNLTSICSEGTQQTSRAASKKPFKFPAMSRQERVLRYFEKKKARKCVKNLQYTSSSRKRYAQIRPRVRGRFARISQTDVQ